MKKSMFSPWYVKLMIVIFCVLAVILTVVCFKDGYKDGFRSKANIQGGQGASSK